MWYAVDNCNACNTKTDEVRRISDLQDVLGVYSSTVSLSRDANGIVPFNKIEALFMEAVTVHTRPMTEQELGGESSKWDAVYLGNGVVSFPPSKSPHSLNMPYLQTSLLKYMLLHSKTCVEPLKMFTIMTETYNMIEIEFSAEANMLLAKAKMLMR